MAIRLNASGEYAKITSTQGLPGAQYTICGWAKSTYRTSAYQYWGVDGTAYAYIGYPNSSTMEFTTGGGPGEYGNFTSSPDDETWYFWCIRTYNAGADLKGGLWRVGDAAMQWVTSTVSFTPTAFTLGNQTYDEYMNAAYAHVKIWSAELSDAQVEAEMWEPEPVVQTNVHLWSSFTENANDESGNGRHWTTAGSPTYETGPDLGGPEGEPGQIWSTVEL